jgi:hypothetical protein
MNTDLFRKSILSAGLLNLCAACNFAYANTGLVSIDSESWNQNTAGIVSDSRSGESFGSAVAFGDFNGDGYRDMVVGVPGEDVSGSTVGMARKMV